MHTRKRTIGEFVITPMQPGSFEVQVNVICEEFSEPRTFKLPITVISKH